MKKMSKMLLAFLLFILMGYGASQPTGLVSSLSQSGDNLFSTLVPLPAGTVSSSSIASLNDSEIAGCPSCYENGPLSVSYGDKEFEVLLTSNTLLVFQADPVSKQTVLSTSVRFNPQCRPWLLASSVHNRQNFYVAFQTCLLWKPQFLPNTGDILTPTGQVPSNSGPSIVSSGLDENFELDDFFISINAEGSSITVTASIANYPEDIQPASDQCTRYTNLFPLVSPSALSDELANFIVECVTTDLSVKLFRVKFDGAFYEYQTSELRGISGVPHSFTNSDYLAFRSGSELIITNAADFSQDPGRWTFNGDIEELHFYLVGDVTWLTVTIANQNQFVVNAGEFLSTRGSNSTIFELPNTNSGLCSPNCYPQRLVTEEHLVTCVQNTQGRYDYVVIDLNTTRPTETMRMERITARPFYFQFQEILEPFTFAPETTIPEITTEVSPTTQEPTSKPTVSPVYPSRRPRTTPIVCASVAAAVIVLLVAIPLIAVGVGVWCKRRENGKQSLNPIPETGLEGTMKPTSENSSLDTSLDDVSDVYKLPYEETAQN